MDLYSAIRKLINNKTPLFNGVDGLPVSKQETYAQLIEECNHAFALLEENKDELEDENITDDLNDFIQYGICVISHNFESGKLIGPNVMNVLIRAVKLYNNSSSRPFQLELCDLSTLDGMLFLSNTVLEIVHRPDLQFFPPDYPPWQLHKEPRPRPRPSVVSEKPLSQSPRVIVMHAHGIMPVVTGDAENPKLPMFKFPFEGRAFGPSEQPIIISSRAHRKNRVVEFETPVDVFTTVQFGKPLHWIMKEDPQQLLFAKNLLEMVAANKGNHTKSEFRQMIKHALCKMRDEHIKEKICKVRCHRAGNVMTDLFLFDEGAAIVEGIISINTQTGIIDHVTQQFGLVRKETVREFKSNQPLSEHVIESSRNARANAESKLAALQAAGTVPETYEMYVLDKYAKNLDLDTRGMFRESEFEFSHEMKQLYGDKIRLSALLQIGITTGLINPDDLVVVLSCRIPEKHLPIGSKSPRRSNESDSEGGGRNSKKYKNLSQIKKRNKCKIKLTLKKSRHVRKIK